MTERILGPTGSPRRRRWLGVPVALVLALGRCLIAGAQAVHDEDFQLDGTRSRAGGPVDSDSRLGQPVRLGRRNEVVADRVRPRGPDKDFNMSQAGKAFLTNDSTTYATGSKDTLPISGWQCNFDNNVNSKIDVMNAYAATYTAPNGDEIIYFALERNANTGTADVGFWFLQDAVGCTSTGGCSDVHRTAQGRRPAGRVGVHGRRHGQHDQRVPLGPLHGRL